MGRKRYLKCLLGSIFSSQNYFFQVWYWHSWERGLKEKCWDWRRMKELVVPKRTDVMKKLALLLCKILFCSFNKVQSCRTSIVEIMLHYNCDECFKAVQRFVAKIMPWNAIVFTYVSTCLMNAHSNYLIVQWRVPSPCQSFINISIHDDLSY